MRKINDIDGPRLLDFSLGCWPKYCLLKLVDKKDNFMAITASPKNVNTKPTANTTDATGTGAAEAAEAKAKNGTQGAAAGESAYKAVDATAAQLTRVPVASVGGQQARVAALLKKGQINSPEELFAKLNSIESNQEAADFLGVEFAKVIKGAVG